jgi:hypothetical protein
VDALGADPDQGELVDGALVERLLRIAGEEARLEHLVPEILEDHQAASRVVLEEGEDRRHAGAEAFQEPLDVDEGVHGGGSALRDLLGLRVRREHHHHVGRAHRDPELDAVGVARRPGRARRPHTPVAPHRRVTRQPTHGRRRHVPSCGARHRATHPGLRLGIAHVFLQRTK